MLVSDFDFDLSEERIAQEPAADRAGARMLGLDRRTGAWEDRLFRDFPERLRAGDLLVLNDSRVIPARLFAHRAGLHTQASHLATGRVQVLLAEQLSEWEWKALVRPGRKVLTGEVLSFGDGELRADMPLPPYIHREDQAGDRERYQTVYARERGSVAAPTAGLHFTPEILKAIRERGVEIVRLTLHVGLGTFQPVRVEKVEDVRLHAERYRISSETAEALNAARREGRRIVAAGTTTVRTLEHCALDGKDFEAHSGSTSIFISPGFEFRVVGALLTNFHLPQSTLLMLVSAFAGQERTLAAYRHAIEAGYRFFSYGDCMFIE